MKEWWCRTCFGFLGYSAATPGPTRWSNITLVTLIHTTLTAHTHSKINIKPNNKERELLHFQKANLLRFNVCSFTGYIVLMSYFVVLFKSCGPCPQTSLLTMCLVWGVLFQVPMRHEIQSRKGSLSNRSGSFQSLSDAKTQHSSLKYSAAGF